MTNSSPTIAITGANGLLGSAIVKRFLQENATVKAVVRTGSDLSLLAEVINQITVIEADVLDLPQLLKALADVDTVVHAAGMVSFNPRKQAQLVQVNVEGTGNLVNACLKLGVSKLIHISSVAALGRTKDIKNVNEESKWGTSQHNTHYAESKYLSELEVFRGMEEGLNVTLLNPSVILAPVKSGQSSAQIFAYVGKEWGFYGDGVINYVDVRDVADMVISARHEALNGERFIANAGTSTIKDLMGAIAKRMNKKAPSVRIGPGISKAAAFLEELRASALGVEPMLTRQSVKILEEEFYFDNTKAREKLKIRFRTLEETLDWCCSELQKGQ